MLIISSLKHGFFNREKPPTTDISFTEKDFNLSQLNLEFATLYEIFISNIDRLGSNSELLLCLNFLCDCLITYYEMDYVAENLTQLHLKKKEIARFIKKQASQNNKDLLELQESNLFKQLKESSKDFFRNFTSSSKTRKRLSAIITNRSYWNYSRALSNNVIAYLQQIGAVDSFKEINELLGLSFTPEEFTAFLDKSQLILRLLGFILYGLRLLLNLIIMTKHIALAALNPRLSCKKVIIQELQKRSYSMCNDLFWGTVNLFNFYGPSWGIEAHQLAKLNLVFLMVDILLFFLLWYIENSQYQLFLNELLLQKIQAHTPLEKAIIERQIDILNDQRKVQSDYYLYNIAAAQVFVIAFAASLIVSGPLTLLCLAAASMFGNALYNTAEEFKQYRQAHIALKREQLNGTHSQDENHYLLMHKLCAKHEEAELSFWKNLLFNAGFTVLIITSATISWPIALSVTLLYISYKLHKKKHDQHSEAELNQEPNNIYRLFHIGNQNISPQEKNLEPISYIS